MMMAQRLPIDNYSTWYWAVHPILGWTLQGVIGISYSEASSPKGWGLSAKLGKHSAIWGKLGTALQAYALNPCTKFPPNPTSRKVNT